MGTPKNRVDSPTWPQSDDPRRSGGFRQLLSGHGDDSHENTGTRSRVGLRGAARRRALSSRFTAGSIIAGELRGLSLLFGSLFATIRRFFRQLLRR